MSWTTEMAAAVKVGDELRAKYVYEETSFRLRVIAVTEHWIVCTNGWEYPFMRLTGKPAGGGSTHLVGPWQEPGRTLAECDIDAFIPWAEKAPKSFTPLDTWRAGIAYERSRNKRTHQADIDIDAFMAWKETAPDSFVSLDTWRAALAYERSRDKGTPGRGDADDRAFKLCHKLIQPCGNEAIRECFNQAVAHGRANP